MGISYYAFLLFFITCVRFRSKKISSAILLHLCKYYISKIYKSSYLIQKGSCQEVSYIFTKVIPFSKSLLFSRVSPPLLRYSNVSFIRLQNTYLFSPLNIPQTAENQGFLESRQTVSIFTVTGILYCIAKVCNVYSGLG